MAPLRSAVVALLALVLLQGVVASDVVELTAANFDSLVLKSSDPWMIEFYAPWCGHCKQLAPEWAKAATALKGIVKFGAVDMDAHAQVGGPYGIKGFPTIKIFGGDKSKPKDYQGARTAAALVDGGLDAAKSVAQARLGGRTGGSSGGSSGGNGGSGKGDVVELTDSNFATKVLQSKELWLVEFFAPWCGHCKRLEPEWARAASQLKGVAKLGAVDATVHQSLAAKYGIQGYPTIKVFVGGQVEDYQGGRSASDFVSFAEARATELTPPPEVVELVSQSVFENDCTSKQICFISFLPALADSNAKERKSRIALLKTLAERFRQRPFGWAWAEGGAQGELEASMDVGTAGYPVMAALNAKKKKFSLFRGSFGEASISEFVNQLVAGRATTLSINGAELPTAATIAPWDGTDAAAKVEEEFDLADLEDVDDAPRAKTEL